MNELPPQEAYDRWAAQYDTDKNRTRDLEALVLRRSLASVPFTRVLEIGCGTGKNTVWLAERASHITAVDLSAGMLEVARRKVTAPQVHFVQADILAPWDFAQGPYDLITFSLVLEHIAELRPVLQAASAVMAPGGHLYIGELHPFKQYSGTQARFTTEAGTQLVRCHDHHVSDFLNAAAGWRLVELGEHFDEDDRRNTPRILHLLFQRP